MPLFEFDCQNCGAVFEKLVLRADAVSKLACPSCGSVKLEEKISAFSSRSKGGAAGSPGASSCAPGGG